MTTWRSVAALFLFASFGSHLAIASSSGASLSKAAPFIMGSAPDNWLGGFGVWSNPNHWSNGIPSVDSAVFITTDSDYVSLDVPAAVLSLSLGSMDGNSTLDGTLGQALSVFNTFTVNQSGAFYLGNGGSLTTAEVYNSGIIDLFTARDHISGQSLTNYPTAYFNIDFAHGGFAHVDNYGAVYVHDGQANLQVTGDFNNHGSINVLMRGQLGVEGTLHNFSGSALNIAGPGASETSNILINYGVINQVGGNLSASTLANGGAIEADRLSTIQVGSGNMVNAGYYQYADGTFAEIIGDHYFGVLTIDGPVQLGGNLDVVLDYGYVPLIGSTYKFMNFTPGMLSGTFASIQDRYFDGGQEMWELQYDNADGFVELIAVPSPEPCSILLIGGGLAAISARAFKNSTRRA